MDKFQFIGMRFQQWGQTVQPLALNHDQHPPARIASNYLQDI
jgi:hypothetical protein